MKHIYLFIIIFCSAVTLMAQSYSPCYTNNIAKGDAFFKQGKYSDAKTYYANAKKCNGGNPSAAQQKINSCDAKIKAQKDAAAKRTNAANSSTPSTQEKLCPSSVKDYDGNTYKTVYIGTQCWMAENLRTTHYANGMMIPKAKRKELSSNAPYYYCPNDDTSNVQMYGLLYNWRGAMGECYSSKHIPSDVRGICPMGWHLPSDSEWTLLTSYLSSHSQYYCDNNSEKIAKSLAADKEWEYSPNSCNVGNQIYTNNTSGFSAVPSGVCLPNLKPQFEYFGNKCYFWTSTTQEREHAYTRDISSDWSYVGLSSSSSVGHYFHALSVRCIRDPINFISKSESEDNEEFERLESLACYEQKIVMDYDGNKYRTVQIGSQCWMAENLRVTHYSNGVSLSKWSANSSSELINNAVYGYPNGNSGFVEMYGLLYNWRAIMGDYGTSDKNPSGVQGLCPDGWHVPSKSEWEQLEEYVRNNYSQEKGKMYASKKYWWYNENESGSTGNNPSLNNTTGFSAVPSGYFDSTSESNSFTRIAHFWSSTDSEKDNTRAYRKRIDYDNRVYEGDHSKMDGGSLRCIRN